MIFNDQESKRRGREREKEIVKQRIYIYLIYFDLVYDIVKPA
jgi:hypothetical protein